MKKAFLLISVLIAAHTSSASAATFVQTLVLSGNSGTATGTAFDKTLGTLTSVGLTVRSTRPYFFTAEADVTATQVVSVELNYVVVYDLSGIVSDLGVASGRVTARIPAGRDGGRTGHASYFRTFSISDVGSLGRFKAGLAPVLDYRFDSPDADVDTFGLVYFNGSFGPLSSDATITYNYTAPVIATAIPEPASWTMMFAGFGLVGGAMRRGAKFRLAAG